MEPIESISPEVIHLRAENKRLLQELNTARTVIAVYEEAELDDDSPVEWLDD